MRKSILWIGVVVMVFAISGLALAQEPVTVSHTLVGYVSDGPTVTLDFSLDIVNNGTAGLSDAEIALAPVGFLDRLLEPIGQEPPLYIGPIPASSGTISVHYTMTTIPILSEEEINSFPIFWQITYTDETGQAQIMIVASEPIGQ